MISIKVFVFNPFQVNTYLLYDETKDCIIIDPGCLNEDERNELSDFITSASLKPVRLLNTHAHVDHIAGNKFVSDKYNIGLEVHKDSLSFLRSAKGYASAFGLDNMETMEPSAYLNDNDVIAFGNSKIKVFYTPGHADGSVCFYSEKDHFVISGDVLFNESIGRTDFPTGNLNKLKESIKTKLFVLPDDTVVYPGHGPTTTIGYEKEFNPFID